MRSGFGLGVGLVALVIGGSTEASAQVSPVPYPPGASCIAALTLPAEYICEGRFPTAEGTVSQGLCLTVDSGPSPGTFVLVTDGGEFVCTCHPGGDGSDEDGDPFAEGAASNEFVCDGQNGAFGGTFRGNGRQIPNAVGVSAGLVGTVRCSLGPCGSPPQ